MWTQSNENLSAFAETRKEKDYAINQPVEFYMEDDDSTTDTGRTLSTIENNSSYYQDSPSSFNEIVNENNDPILFEKFIKDPENTRVSRYQNTYFMDGGNRFISLPTLGNTSTRAASHISRIFEDWLQNKLYHQFSNEERLPILEDSVELLAEDILNKLKSRHSVKGLNGLSRVLLKIRTGHVYTYHQMDNGQPLITADMEDFFQQFPLFVEIIIYTMPKESDQSLDDVQFLLSLENITSNPNDPYYIKEDIQLVC